MRPLTIFTTYNEIDYMPLKKRWCEANGLDLYVLDNYSTDGTWEWLQDNKVNSERVDTRGAFDLPLLQKATMSALRRLEPPWVVYIGADTFYVAAEKLSDYISMVDKKGYNVISFPWNNFFNTGEPRESFDPINTYFYYSTFRRVDFIFKWHPKVEIRADDIERRISEKVLVGPNDPLYKKIFKKYLAKDIEAFNYGNTKPAEIRLETLRRRQKAWDKGMCEDWGKHYREGKKKSWCWDKNYLKDIRQDAKYKYILRLQADIEK